MIWELACAKSELLGTPARPNLLILTKEELAHAKQRLEINKNDLSALPRVSNRQLVKSVFSDWKVYLLTIWAILFWNTSTTSGGGYLLWLKSLKRFSSAKVNQIGASAPAAGIFYILFINFSSDLLWGPSGAIACAEVFVFASSTILAVWDVPEPAKWFAFNLGYFHVSMSSVLYGWANDILRHNTQERSFTLVFMNLIAQSTTAWTPLLVFKTSEGPRWLKGWIYSATMAFLLVVWTYAVIRTFSRRQE